MKAVDELNRQDRGPTDDDPDRLNERWAAFRRDNPGVRKRYAAAELGVSEAQLVALDCGAGNIRLDARFGDILRDLEALGELLAFTRNDYVVHETVGAYRDLKSRGETAMFFQPGQDLRLFLARWRSAFAVDEDGRHSIQFFDTHGAAAHKVYMTGQSDMPAYRRLVEKYRAANQGRVESVTVAETPTVPTDGPAIDRQALADRWSNMTDVHQSSGIIKTFGGGDQQLVYRALDDEYACLLDPTMVEALLTHAAKQQLPLMIFIMGQSAVQSYGGKIHQLSRSGPWFNILDDGFSLHMKSAHIGAMWLLRKPSDDGWITSLDVFDSEGREILVICDDRYRGQAESPDWTNTLQALAGHHPGRPEQ